MIPTGPAPPVPALALDDALAELLDALAELDALLDSPVPVELPPDPPVPVLVLVLALALALLLVVLVGLALLQAAIATARSVALGPIAARAERARGPSKEKGFIGEG